MKIPTIHNFIKYMHEKKPMIFGDKSLHVVEIESPPHREVPKGFAIAKIKLADGTEIIIKELISEEKTVSNSVIDKVSLFNPAENKSMPEKRILHLITQDDQPMGSQRKCCEECGLACDAFPVNHFFMDNREHFTKSKVVDMGYSRCIDKEK